MFVASVISMSSLLSYHLCSWRHPDAPPGDLLPSGVVLEHFEITYIKYLVDPASSHMLVSKIKPCMSKYKLLYTAKLRMAH